jgi:hypothetical protein
MGAYTKDDEAETAQQTYRRMLRDWMAPALRQMGFKGSGAQYRFPDETYEASLVFTRRTLSTREVVWFSVSFFVQHPPTAKAFNAADWLQGKRHENEPTAGYYSGLLEGLVRYRDDYWDDIHNFREVNGAPGWWAMPEPTRIVPRFNWWELPAGGPIKPLADVVLEAIRGLALPAIQRELERPLDPRWASST